MAIKKTPNDYHILAKKHNFEWLGTEVINTKTYTEWKCSRGHRRRARYSDIQGGRGCLDCSNSAPKTIEDYHNLITERGFKWVGKEFPKNSEIKTLWKCPEGHMWEATYQNVRGGTGCPHCAGTFPKTIKDYHVLAEKKGLKWVGKELPPNTRTKTWWKCSEEHLIRKSYSGLRTNRQICPYCNNSCRPNDVNVDQSAFGKVLDEYKQNADRRNLTFDLTPDQFYNLTQCDCYYCDSPPRQKRVYKNGIQAYLFNGIDRIDNDVGYILSNCVPCCKRCNYAKRGLTPSQFMDMIKTIYEKHFCFEQKEDDGAETNQIYSARGF
jgi:hypothetical protein